MHNSRQLIQNNFNTSAPGYLTNAQIQRDSAARIMNELAKLSFADKKILDLGSGPGTFSHQSSASPTNMVLFDLSINMLKNNPADTPAINGDAANLPIADNCIEIVISNLMLQWIEDKSRILAEIQRCLCTDGNLILTTLIEPSLHELRNAWQQVDNLNHTLNFASHADYRQMLTSNAHWRELKFYPWSQTIYFSDIYSLMRHFKNTGTSMPRADFISGLGGKQKLAQLSAAYEKQRTIKGLPLTYCYLLITAQKGQP